MLPFQGRNAYQRSPARADGRCVCINCSPCRDEDRREGRNVCGRLIERRGRDRRSSSSNDSGRRRREFKLFTF